MYGPYVTVASIIHVPAALACHGKSQNFLVGPETFTGEGHSG